jgi:5-methylcytosine-specific restriction enzyme A
MTGRSTLRPCLDCPTLVRGASRCPPCTARREQARDQRRGRTAQRGYGAAWQRVVGQAIQAQPWCSVCLHPGSPDNPLTGDHIQPLQTGGPCTPANVQVLCRRHNSAKGGRSA